MKLDCVCAFSLVDAELPVGVAGLERAKGYGAIVMEILP
jgi:hypothetical protein